MAEKKIRLAQNPFLSVQGEGPRTGKLTVFVRFFGCNLSCKGFFQDHPTKPDTYIKPVLLDPKSYKTLDEFPVVEVGCDTLYAIDPKYKHLAIDYASVDALVAEIESLLPKAKDGTPVWIHPQTWNEYDICFTGGEPLLQQEHVSAILSKLASGKTRPAVYQFETNGTQKLENVLINTIQSNKPNVLFNVSPKLFNVTGEPTEKTWFPEILNTFKSYGDVALKFVVNDKKDSFDELANKICELHQPIPVYIMPCGATKDQQSDLEYISNIAFKAIGHGYHISSRVHVTLFGNSPGT